MLQVVTLYYGGHLVINNEITGGELVSLLLYQVSLTAALDVSAIQLQPHNVHCHNVYVI